MATVTAFEAKTRFGELLARVAKGEEIVITKYERPVARIVPEKQKDLERVRRAIQGMQELQARMRKRGMRPLTVQEILDARDEGRK